MELFQNIKNKTHDASGVEFPNNWWWDVDNLKIDSTIYYPVQKLREDELHTETSDWVAEQGLPAWSLDELMVQSGENGEDYLMTPEQLERGQIFMDMFENHVEEPVERSLTEEVEYFLTVLWSTIGIDRPANHSEIAKYIEEDVEAAADPVDYHSGDMEIAFRRYLEKDLEL